MAGINWTAETKAVLDTYSGQNHQISFEFLDGKLKAITVKIIPLTLNIEYRFEADRYGNLICLKKG
jgi:hypothetical protein